MLERVFKLLALLVLGVMLAVYILHLPLHWAKEGLMQLLEWVLNKSFKEVLNVLDDE